MDCFSTLLTFVLYPQYLYSKLVITMAPSLAAC